MSRLSMHTPLPAAIFCLLAAYAMCMPAPSHGLCSTNLPNGADWITLAACLPACLPACAPRSAAESAAKNASRGTHYAAGALQQFISLVQREFMLITRNPFDVAGR